MCRYACSMCMWGCLRTKTIQVAWAAHTQAGYSSARLVNVTVKAVMQSHMTPVYTRWFIHIQEDRPYTTYLMIGLLNLTEWKLHTPPIITCTSPIITCTPPIITCKIHCSSPRTTWTEQCLVKDQKTNLWCTLRPWCVAINPLPTNDA